MKQRSEYIMKKFLEVVGAVFLAFIDGKKVAMELNETPEQPRTKRKESPKQIQTLKTVLHT
ncbi:hypothetical protein bcere0014_43410 [Bacillus cereus BDRD-ST196]|nr:hypothetical protein bcere0014_43410 [Bacillus cereus BDRD-ST196]